MKQELKLMCECGKEIKGFSDKHIKKNLEIHKLLSKEHKDRMNIMENIRNNKPICTFNLSNDLIIFMLSSHPYMIEDIKEIGRINA